MVVCYKACIRWTGYGSRLLKYVEEDFLRDTLKAAAVTLGTSARLHPWLLQIYEKEGMKYTQNMRMTMAI